MADMCFLPLCDWWMKAPGMSDHLWGGLLWHVDLPHLGFPRGGLFQKKRQPLASPGLSELHSVFPWLSLPPHWIQLPARWHSSTQAHHILWPMSASFTLFFCHQGTKKKKKKTVRILTWCNIVFLWNSLIVVITHLLSLDFLGYYGNSVANQWRKLHSNVGEHVASG